MVVGQHLQFQWLGLVSGDVAQEESGPSSLHQADLYDLYVTIDVYHSSVDEECMALCESPGSKFVPRYEGLSDLSGGGGCLKHIHP